MISVLRQSIVIRISCLKPKASEKVFDQIQPKLELFVIHFNNSKTQSNNNTVDICQKFFVQDQGNLAHSSLRL